MGLGGINGTSGAGGVTPKLGGAAKAQATESGTSIEGDSLSLSTSKKKDLASNIEQTQLDGAKKLRSAGNTMMALGGVAVAAAGAAALGVVSIPAAGLIGVVGVGLFAVGGILSVIGGGMADVVQKAVDKRAEIQ